MNLLLSSVVKNLKIGQWLSYEQEYSVLFVCFFDSRCICTDILLKFRRIMSFYLYFITSLKCCPPSGLFSNARRSQRIYLSPKIKLTFLSLIYALLIFSFNFRLLFPFIAGWWTSTEVTSDTSFRNLCQRGTSQYTQLMRMNKYEITPVIMLC